MRLASSYPEANAVPRPFTPTRAGTLGVVCLVAALNGRAAAQRLPSAGVQQTSVGAVGQLSVIGNLQRCQPTVGQQGSVRQASAETPQATIRRGGESFPVVKGASATVFLGDRFTVERNTDVRLTIQSRGLGTGSIVLAPQVLCSVVRDADTALTPLATPVHGAYAIESARDTLQLVIVDGGAIVQWEKATGHQLIVIAAGAHAVVTGTEFAITADSARHVGALYVRDGVVRIAGVDVSAGEFVGFRGGRVSALLSRTPDLDLPADKDLHLHCRVIECVNHIEPVGTGGGHIGKIVTFVTVAAVAGGATAYCVQRDDRCGLRRTTSKNRTVTVQVHIPL